MSVDWQLLESGARADEPTILLLPGGMCGAGSWAEVMAQPNLARMRLVAATLPGHAGAPPPADFTIENYAALTAGLAAQVNADVLVGFSMGACVALEMAISGLFRGPTVLLGVSLSAPDDPVSFRAIARLGDLLGTLPATALIKAARAMTQRIPLDARRRAELREDFSHNDPRHIRRSLREYLRWLTRDENRAQQLCATGRPTWIVHAERGDGGLTADERHTLEACPGCSVITLPGSVYLLPNLAAEAIAATIVEAAAFGV